jgi:hypothetical protein
MARRPQHSRPRNELVESNPDYWMSVVGYLERPLGRESPEILARFLSRVYAALGDASVHLYSVEPAEPPQHVREVRKEARLVAALDPGFVPPVRDDETAVHIYQQRSASINARSAVLWGITCDPRSGDGDHTSDAILGAHFNTAALGVQSVRWMALACQLVSELDRTGICYSGLVDVAPDDEVACGRYFEALQSVPHSWHRTIERAEWDASGLARRQRIRGPYWGTYIGPALSERVNAGGELMRGFLDFHPSGIRKPQVAREFPGGGLFLALSDDPVEVAKYRVGPVDWQVETAVWLRLQLRRLRAL